MNIENYLKLIPLFQSLSPADIKKIADSIEIVTAKKGDIIISEGNLAKEFYILMQGSVSIYKSNGKEKIPLTNLNENAYFGEQAYFSNYIRTATVEVTADAKLLEIHYSTLDYIFHASSQLRDYLEDIALQNNLKNMELEFTHTNNVINDILSGSNLYKSIYKRPRLSFLKYFQLKFQVMLYVLSFKKFFQPDIIIKKYKKNEIIFKKNAPAKHVYLIVSGSVVLSFEDNNTTTDTILSDKNIFGEVGVLNNKPRSATAKALTRTSVLAISKKYFLMNTDKSLALKSLTASLSKVYSLQNCASTIYQFVGTFHGQKAIFTHYRLDNGRVIECSKIIDQSLLTFKLINNEPSTVLTFRKGNILERKIMLHEQRIVGLVSFGEWDEIEILFPLMLRNKPLEAAWYKDFEETGNVFLTPSDLHLDQHFICSCMSISYKMVKALITDGKNNLEDIKNITGATTICGSCTPKILDVLNQSNTTYVTLDSIISSDPAHFTLSISPIHRKKVLKYRPQQEIVLSVQINGVTYEKVFKLLNAVTHGKSSEITIKIQEDEKLYHWLMRSSADAPILKLCIFSATI